MEASPSPSPSRSFWGVLTWENYKYRELEKDSERTCNALSANKQELTYLERRSRMMARWPLLWKYTTTIYTHMTLSGQIESNFIMLHAKSVFAMVLSAGVEYTPTNDRTCSVCPPRVWPRHPDSMGCHDEAHFLFLSQCCLAMLRVCISIPHTCKGECTLRQKVKLPRHQMIVNLFFVISVTPKYYFHSRYQGLVRIRWAGSVLTWFEIWRSIPHAQTFWSVG